MATTDVECGRPTAGQMGPRWLVAALCGALLVSAGCLEQLPKAQTVEKLRVLAVVADPPEVGAGESVSLRALVVDKEGRDITLSWRVCLLPERNAGFAASQQTQSSGGGGYGLEDPGTCFALSPPLPDGALELGQGVSTDAEQGFTVPADLFDDPATLAALYGIPLPEAQAALVSAFLLKIAGVNVTVALEARAGDDVVTAFKRVNVSTAAQKNQNPTEVLFHLRQQDAAEAPPDRGPEVAGRCLLGEERGPLTISAGTWLIKALNVPDPQPRYEVLIAGGQGGQGTDACSVPIQGCEVHEENLFYSMFSTVGELNTRVVKASGQRTNQWTLTAEDLAGKDRVPLWIVTRDGRGGTSFCASELVVKQEPR